MTQPVLGSQSRWKALRQGARLLLDTTVVLLPARTSYCQIVLSRQENTKQRGDIFPDVKTEPEADVEQMMQTCVKPTWVQRRKPDENLLSLCQFKIQVLAVCPILLSSGVIPALPLLAK